MTLVKRSLTDAQTVCLQITKAAAANFYWGIRLLPREKRAALCAVYALARRIDDIGDGELPPADKTCNLAVLRKSLNQPGSDPVLVAVHDSAGRFPIPMGAFDELIDGVAMDIAGTRYRTFDELVGYCQAVAGSVGRLCLGVFGASSPSAPTYANQLGIALQQTNILRDIREDLAADRVYIPQQDLDRVGLTLRLDPAGRLMDRDAVAELVRRCAARAQDWYSQGLRLLPLLDHRSAASAAAMAGIYHRLLHEIAAHPAAVCERRISLSGRQKATVAARALSGVAA